MLPPTVHKEFVALIDTYKKHPIEFPHLKAITVAQWALECGWGGTGLAKKHNNFAGAKWRPYMAPYGYQVQYPAHDGMAWYTNFNDYKSFIDGYWKRLDLEPMYKGWREHTATPEAFIRFVGPIWVGTDDADKRKYVRNILRIYDAYKLADDFKETPNENQSIKSLDFGSRSNSISRDYTSK